MSKFFTRGRSRLVKHSLISLVTLLLTVSILHRLETHKNAHVQYYMKSIPVFVDSAINSISNGRINGMRVVNGGVDGEKDGDKDNGNVDYEWSLTSFFAHYYPLDSNTTSTTTSTTSGKMEDNVPLSLYSQKTATTSSSMEIIQRLKNLYKKTIFNQHNVKTNNIHEAYDYYYYYYYEEDEDYNHYYEENEDYDHYSEESLKDVEEQTRERLKEKIPQLGKNGKTYDFNIKRTLAAYYKLIDNDPDIRELPFNWYDWRDIGKYLNPYIETNDLTKKLKCDIFNQGFNVDSDGNKINENNEKRVNLSETEISQYCTNVETAKFAPGISNPTSKSTSSTFGSLFHQQEQEQQEQHDSEDYIESVGIDVSFLYDHVSKDTMDLITSTYLYNGKMQPLSITFLDERSGKIKQYPLKHSKPFFHTKDSDVLKEDLLITKPEKTESEGGEHVKRKIKNSGTKKINILDLAMKIDYQDTEIKLKDKIDRFDTIIDNDDLKYLQKNGETTSSSSSTIIGKQNKNVLESHQKNFDEAKKFIKSSTNDPEFRYFLECRDFDAHIYPQFFNFPLEHNTLKKGQSLHDLARIWFKFIEGTKTASWLAHGSLLAYMYNGDVFPWDDDHDVQMPIDDLIQLSEKFNQTIIVTESGSPMFLDISPYILKGRHHSGEWFNHIDARIVDVTTGFYIDITGVGYSNVHKISNIHDHLRFPDESFLGDSILEKKDGVLDFHKEHGIVNCKNKHFSLIEELLPTRKVLFGGVPVQVPFQLLPPLRSEYSMSKFYYTRGINYREQNFVPELRAWLPNIWTEQKFGGYYFENNRIGQTDIKTLYENLMIPTRADVNDFKSAFLNYFDDEHLLYVLNLQKISLNRLEMLGIESDTTKSVSEKTLLLNNISTFPLVERPHKSRLVNQYLEEKYNQAEQDFNQNLVLEFFNFNLKKYFAENFAKILESENFNEEDTDFLELNIIPQFGSKEEVLEYIKNEAIEEEIVHFIETEKQFHMDNNYDFESSFETDNYFYPDVSLPTNLNNILNNEIPKIYKLRKNSNDPEKSAKPKPFLKDFN